MQVIAFISVIMLDGQASTSVVQGSLVHLWCKDLRSVCGFLSLAINSFVRSRSTF